MFEVVADRAMRLLTTTKVRDAIARYEKGGALSFVLPAKISPAQLRRLVDRHSGQPYFDQLISAVALHRSADESVLEAIYQSGRLSIAALDTIATAPRTPVRILKRLSRSRHASVRRHSRIALVLDTMKTADTRAFDALLEREGRDPEIGDGVSWHLAVNPRTPREVLERLAREAELDLVAKEARRRLRGYGGARRGRG